MYYQPTNDLEVYKPGQVEVVNGSCTITFTRGIAHGDSQQYDGKVVDVAKAYKSGFVSGWVSRAAALAPRSVRRAV